MDHQGNLAVVNYMYREEGPPEWFAAINARYATRIDPIKHYHEEIETQITTDVALLSNELLVQKPVDYLDFIFDQFEHVTVHVVFRPKPLLLESHYLQNVQQGHYKHDINEIFTHPASAHRIENTLRYARYYKKWVGKVGKENVRVHFLSAGHAPIHEQVCSEMGLEDFSSFRIPDPQNEAISPFEACVLCSVEQDIPYPVLAKARRLIRSMLPQQQVSSEKRTLVNANLLQQIKENTWLDNRRFSRVQSLVNEEDLSICRKLANISFEEIRGQDSFVDAINFLDSKGIPIRKIKN